LRAVRDSRGERIQRNTTRKDPPRSEGVIPKIKIEVLPGGRAQILDSESRQKRRKVTLLFKEKKPEKEWVSAYRLG